jgi:hypothetical protein
VKLRLALDQSGKQMSIGTTGRMWSIMVLLVRLVGGRLQNLTSFPYSRPLHLTLRPGSKSSTGDWSFNPSFSDWMMGWPIGWSDSVQQETGLSLWLQRMRGALSELPSVDDRGTLLPQVPQ